MFEDLPLIYLSVRILTFWSFIYEYNWKRFFCLSLATFLIFTELVYMYETKEGIDSIIRNSYMLVLWINTVLRAYILSYDRKDYESLIQDLRDNFYELQKSKDAYIQGLLKDVNKIGKRMARGNVFLGLLTCIGFGLYPLFAEERVLPFGSIIPGVNEYATPYYEFLYVYQMVVTPMGCCMYIPYTSLIVAFVMFAIVMCKTLQHRLRNLSLLSRNDNSIEQEIIECIKYQKRIIEYVSIVNRLTTFIFLVEFIAFGTLLCALLFLLIIVDSSAQAIIVCAYITMIFAQIFALYWYANELREQNWAIAKAAYDTNWFTFKTPLQKYILLLILRAQKPCTIKVGNTYPMTLELFQSLLNASYTYFTLLKRVYS